MIWKILTLAFAATSILLLLLQLKQFREPQRLYEPRLIGTWISDIERTQQHLPEYMTEPYKKQLLSVLRKTRVTYTPAEYTTVIDGLAEKFPYTVLGLDKHSVVIRDDSATIPDLEVLKMSTFSRIHFDGPDSYWVTTDGLTEYFRRVSANPK
jgi:hypothetical protein